MKKLIIGIFFLSLASLVYPQDPCRESREVVLEGVTISPINIDYLNKVIDNTTAKRVFDLQAQAASFNLLNSRYFKGKGGLYWVTFKQHGGLIFTTFDDKGKILRSNESFKDILFPKAILKSIYRAHPGWTMSSNEYLVSYSHGKDVKKSYKVLLSKGNLKKRILINPVGDLLALID
ncbi:hypothetical protein [Kriegella aquimaris]|uniref:Beta-lactamase-inhibitor-like, PepSY-like n=1 Tax=Kriegella aquimaris TaxID=192904 RepID=A0A1G9PQS0_9FLAO|nr:hypothetical protein [Kriegella aquimaris]SDM00435.1 hypothetical protein SAMN04488514_10484 [Kriegella aquimaris]